MSVWVFGCFVECLCEMEAEGNQINCAETSYKSPSPPVVTNTAQPREYYSLILQTHILTIGYWTYFRRIFDFFLRIYLILEVCFG